MLASTKSTALLSVGQTSKRLGVSPQTIRNMVESGVLQTIRTLGGHRRIPESSIREYLGFDEQSEVVDSGIPICLCGRVSTNKQASHRGQSEQSDLDRQTDRLRGWVTANHPNARVTEYIAVRSGLNFSDKTFVRMVEDILSGKFRGGLLVCTHRERVCRLAGDFLQVICRQGECELVEIAQDMERSFEESIADELLALTHVFSCRHYGRRAAINNSKHVSDDCLRRMVELRERNMSVDAITRVLNEEGYKMGKGKEEKTETITEWCVAKYLDGNGIEKGIKTAIHGVEQESGELIAQFVEAQIVKTGEKSDRLTNKEIRERYTEWCQNRGMVPEQEATLGKKLSGMGWERGKVQSVRFWVGVRWAG